jgi:RNA polymerase sigma factor (sigma-70 family)
VLAARPALLAFLVSLLRDLSLAEEVFKDLCVAASQGKLEGVSGSDLAPILKAARSRAMAFLHARSSEGLRMPPDELVDRIEEAILEMTQPQPPWEERREALRKALRLLPSALRQILDLRYGHRLVSSEMAKRMGLDLATVQQRLQQARAGLQAEVRWSDAEGQAQ